LLTFWKSPKAHYKAAKTWRNKTLY